MANKSGLQQSVIDAVLKMDDLHLSDRATIEKLVVEKEPLIDQLSIDTVVDRVLSDLQGLGPLEALINDRNVTDILAVANRYVWVERHGTLCRTDVLLGEGILTRIIERIVGPLGLHVDRASPMVDARLTDGSRVNAVLPPVSIDGPCLAIRRFSESVIPLHRFADDEVVARLEDIVARRMNVLISGATGSGKTALLNALSSRIPACERVVTIEDTAELRLDCEQVVRLEARGANSEGAGAVTMRQLVRNALRMRPDRIVIGEVRGAEAFDMVQALNTGHSGSMSTCHAKSCSEALARLEAMMMMADVRLASEVVRKQLAFSIDCVIHVVRDTSGGRRVSQIAEMDRGGAHSVLRTVWNAD